MDPTHSHAPPSAGADDAHEFTDLRERLAYLEFDEQDRAQLQDLNDRLRDRRDEFVDEFPLTSSGKIRRAELRRRNLEAIAARGPAPPAS